MTSLHLCVLLAVVLLSYPVLMRILARAVHHRRLAMADLGVRLLRQGECDHLREELIRSMLRDAFDPRVAIHMAAAVPLFVIRALQGRVNMSRLRKDDGDFGAFCRAHLLSIFAANPLFFAIFVVELMVFSAFYGPLQVLRGRRGDKLFDAVLFATTKADGRIGGHAAFSH